MAFVLCLRFVLNKQECEGNPTKNKSSIKFCIHDKIPNKVMHVCMYACREMQRWARRLHVDGLHAKPPLVVATKEILSS